MGSFLARLKMSVKKADLGLKNWNRPAALRSGKIVACLGGTGRCEIATVEFTSLSTLTHFRSRGPCQHEAST
jgi:hypothetical protein